jgi:transcriptional regulator with XRE-family HTH domain
MALRESTARTRELGAELRRVREGARYTGNDLALKLGWSASKVSRMETGARNTSPLDTATYVAFCGVSGPELDRLLELTRPTDEYWLQPRGERLPDELRSLIALENTAQLLVYYEPMVVPGLLQTEDYARALFQEGGLLLAEGIEPRVRLRLDRQRLLRHLDAPTVTFFVHEHAVRTVVGDRRLMHEQLLHMLLVCAAPPCRLRVVPAGVGGFAGVGQFTWAAHPDHNPVIYVEHLTTSLFLENRMDMLAYRGLLDRLTRLALNEGQSRELLANLASKYEP